MPSKKYPEKFLLIISSLIILWGTFTLATVSFPHSLQDFGDSWYYFSHQLLMGILPGIILSFILYKIDLDLLKKWSPFILGANIILLLLVFIPGLGIKIGGARRWINLGFATFQPSEFLKISFLLYLSAWLSNRVKESKKKKKHKNWQAFSVFGISGVIIALILLLQPDLSTLGIIFVAAIAVYFVSSTPWWHMLIIGGGAGTAFLLMIKLAPYRMARVAAMLNPQVDPLGISYQLKQALIAIGSGKLLGVGSGLSFGLSRQKFGFLPETMSDSIFAIIGEELGFIGTTLFIILFLLFLMLGLRAAINSKTEFKKLLGVGIVTWITVQTFFNIAGIIGILPLSGIPLPFFSYGSSHLITEMMGVGILLNISKDT